MKHIRKHAFIFALCIMLSITLLSGCRHNEENTTKSDTEAQAVKTDTGDTAETEDITQPKASSKNAGDIRPDEKTVLAIRKAALEGMSEDDIKHLNSVIINANLALESRLIFGELQDKLTDPESDTWKYLDYTGDFIIGYAYSEDILNQKDSLGLTDEEFQQQYGEPVYAHNDYDTQKILSLLKEIQNTIHNEVFRQNFSNMADLLKKAQETHDVNCIINIYRILHDMDYYLLRYGPEDMKGHVDDMSTIRKYYGVLEDYKGTEYEKADGFVK